MLTKEDFFINMDFADISDAYESFKWLDENITSKNVLLITAFGDLVFTDNSGHIQMLDLIEGSIVGLADDVNQFQQLFNTRKFQSEFFLCNLLLTLKEKNKIRGPREVYAFQVPMIIGGEAVSDNVVIMDLKVWIHLIGQLHQQVKDLPPGTKITGFKISE